MHDYDIDAPTRARRHIEDREPRRLRPPRRAAAAAARAAEIDADPAPGVRRSTWDDAGVRRGPEPYPDWVVTELAACDTELGVVKTGKEADVHLVERGIPDTDRSCLLAAKRYRSGEHRMFHRDAGYLEGRKLPESRMNRAMAHRTRYGRALIAEQWPAAEFVALCQLWAAGVEAGHQIVPYPVQVLGSELLLEYIRDDRGGAAPRLAELHPDPAQLADFWLQLVDALHILARCGLTHGDLSPYNILVHEGQLLLIDLPQIVDLVVNPSGPRYLRRDVHNVTGWFVARGLSHVDEHEMAADLLDEAGM